MKGRLRLGSSNWELNVETITGIRSVAGAVASLIILIASLVTWDLRGIGISSAVLVISLAIAVRRSPSEPEPTYGVSHRDE